MATLFNTIKHALFLENEFWGDQVMVGHLHDYLVSLGVQCTVIDRASHRKAEIIAALATADAVCFESTFIYEGEVKSVGDLLRSVNKPLLVFGGVIGGTKELRYEIEKLWGLKELVEMSHHRVFELEFTPYSLEDGLEDEYYTEIDMSRYKTEWERLEQERITKNKNMPKTGNKVLIKQIQAFGEQWSNLKEGDVVDELDCSSIDENPTRGIWVMGKDEPVKLLNSEGYEEWEYSEPSYLALTKEFFSRGNRANAYNDSRYRELFMLMADWIRKNSSELRTSDAELWDWCDVICESVGVERRVNRRYFERRLKEYGGKHKYFREEV